MTLLLIKGLPTDIRPKRNMEEKISSGGDGGETAIT
jgi:hypothetical protein